MLSQKSAMVLVRLMVGLSLLGLMACGNEPPVLPKDGRSLFPVAMQNRWEFRITESNGDTSTKIQNVTGTSTAGMEFTTMRGDRMTVSVQRVNEQMQLVRVSEVGTDMGTVIETIRFDPPQVRLDLSQRMVGATYSHSFVERHIDDGLPDKPKMQTFTVEAVDELVEVPAGAFECVRVRRQTVGGPSKTYWYAPGVGKVREAGGQQEELVSFTVN